MTDAACPHCAAAFSAADLRDLHVGRVHAEAASHAQQEAFAAALRREEETLARVRRHIRGGLHALPLAFLYLVVLAIAATYNVLYMGLLPLPGVIAFTVFVYLIGYSERQTGRPPTTE